MLVLPMLLDLLTLLMLLKLLLVVVVVVVVVVRVLLMSRMPGMLGELVVSMTTLLLLRKDIAVLSLLEAPEAPGRKLNMGELSIEHRRPARGGDEKVVVGRVQRVGEHRGQANLALYLSLSPAVPFRALPACPGKSRPYPPLPLPTTTPRGGQE